jgi:hypothetical protein
LSHWPGVFGSGRAISFTRRERASSPPTRQSVYALARSGALAAYPHREGFATGRRVRRRTIALIPGPSAHSGSNFSRTYNELAECCKAEDEPTASASGHDPNETHWTIRGYGEHAHGPSIPARRLLLVKATLTELGKGGPSSPPARGSPDLLVASPVGDPTTFPPL